MEKLNIIFVDDEIRVLQGLKRMLRSMRSEWNMVFEQDSQKVPDILRQKKFDIIVSDMRMPGMDGLELLNLVKQEFPYMVRIALSGQTSKESILQSVGPIHQYLSKPCEAETLKTTITHIAHNRDVLMNQKLRGLISQLESLPCMKASYSTLIEELNARDTSIDKIAKVINHDLAMTTKILQLVNSSFFGVRQDVSNTTQAIKYLGLKTIKSLVLSLKIFSEFDNDASANLLEQLWRHSFRVSEFAKTITDIQPLSDEEMNYVLIAAMLHDVGKLVLVSYMPDEYLKVLHLAQDQDLTASAAERQILNTTHAEIGAYLLGLWGFSPLLIEAIRYHHQPAKIANPTFNIVTIIHVADYIAREIDTITNSHDTTHDNPNNGNPLQPRASLDMDYLEHCGVARQLTIWKEKCIKNSQAVAMT